MTAMSDRPAWLGVRVDRRGFLRLAAGGVALAGATRAASLAALAPEIRRQGKACILLWMAGGPSQFETFDPKPGASTQGPTKAIDTAVPGVRIAEHWKHTAGVMGEVAVLRSLTSKEGNHGRATYLLHTSYPPTGGVVHPGFGSLAAQALAPEEFDLPHVVSISGPSASSSFLGVKYSPFVITDPTRPPDNLPAPVPVARLGRRLDLLRELEAETPSSQVKDHQALYDQTSRLILSPRCRAFRLEEEPARVRGGYGASAFGQGCLMARRLVEAGVTFIEVESGGWDTHGNELASLQKLIPPVDQAVATLLLDLKVRGLLERTLVIWMGEFGRSPRINLTAGRDHYPHAFNAFLAGCGVQGGRVVGATDKLGAEVVDRPISVEDLFCTFCHALGMDPRRENQSNVGRPVKVVEHGAAVREVF
jgi:hypothetical protein